MERSSGGLFERGAPMLGAQKFRLTG